MRHLALALCLLSIINAQSISAVVPTCGTSSYYDTTQYLCQLCPENTIQDATGRACKCRDGFIIKNDTRFDFQKTCVKCTGDSAPSQDLLRCLPCGGDSFFNPLSQACVCPEGQITVDRDLTGAIQSSITCRACLNNTYVGPNTKSVWTCQSCPHYAMVRSGSSYACTCPSPTWIQAGDTCILQSDKDKIDENFYALSSANFMTYESLINAYDDLSKTTIQNLDIYNQFYYDAAVGCLYDQSPTKCQVLANLCVLQIFGMGGVVHLLRRQFTMLGTSILSQAALDSYSSQIEFQGFPKHHPRDLTISPLKKVPTIRAIYSQDTFRDRTISLYRSCSSQFIRSQRSFSSTKSPTAPARSSSRSSTAKQTSPQPRAIPSTLTMAGSKESPGSTTRKLQPRSSASRARQTSPSPSSRMPPIRIGMHHLPFIQRGII